MGWCSGRRGREDEGCRQAGGQPKLDSAEAVESIVKRRDGAE